MKDQKYKKSAIAMALLSVLFTLLVTIPVVFVNGITDSNTLKVVVVMISILTGIVARIDWWVYKNSASNC